MSDSVKVWLHGLAAAIVDGGVTGGLLILVDPKAFNFGSGTTLLLSISAAFGLKGALLYLKQSPLPSAGVTISKDTASSSTITLQPKPTVNPESTGIAK
jgi:hypothetical protein